MGERIIVPTKQLIQTHPCLDTQYVDELISIGPREIQKIKPAIKVCRFNFKFFVIDGSNRVEALKRLQVRQISVDCLGSYQVDPENEILEFNRLFS